MLDCWDSDKIPYTAHFQFDIAIFAKLLKQSEGKFEL